MSGLSRRQLLNYALPALPLAVPTVAVYILLPTYYVEEIGLPLLLTGLLLMLARLSDVFTDPLIGRWLDHATASQFKRTLAGGGLLCIPALILLIQPLSSAPAVSLLLGSMLLYLGWTLVQVPYISWLSHLSRDSHQRARAVSLREGLALLGLLLSACIPLLLVLGFSTQQMLWCMALVTLIPGAVFLFRLLNRLPAPQPEPSLSPGKWQALRQNRPAMRLVSAWFINGMANGIPAVLFPLYVTSVLGLEASQRPLFILVYFLSACCALPLWLSLSQRYDKITLWQSAMTLALLAFIPAACLGPGDTYLFILICILTGAALGADLALPHAIQAEVTDWDRFRFRRRQTSLLFAVWNAATKMALALAALVALGLLEVTGFSTDSVAPFAALGMIYALLPGVLKGVAVLILWRFPLRSYHHRAIMNRLKQREHWSAPDETTEPVVLGPAVTANRV
ncbi:Sugar transporter [Nitrincola lacisaponensis]|uniref:Sugar transporter n=1 Tax=Nitrincola lacisaponensis TaxID=267850 RepID=A0A063XYB3_9GAMM|nr:MFS transporter [Nitrincola lacisaponensis]KDE39143.1 Sugar transporter [Nitrincola lacisaponensis]